MKKLLITILFVLFLTSVYSQSFKVSKNVISTSLLNQFTDLSGYNISYERMLDPGYSLNVAQFSYKLNASIISNKKKAVFTSINTQSFFDEDAYLYKGYSILPEIKYYFTWNAPVGFYLNIFGSYTNYTRSYTNIQISDEVSEEKSFKNLGRGIGSGFQFKVFKNFTLDIVGGYHLQNITSKTKLLGNEDFIENPMMKSEKLYANIFFGIIF